MVKKIIKNIDYNIIAIISMTVLAVIYWCLFDFLRWDMFDSPSFIAGARQIFGLEGGFNSQSRLSKPIVLILPGMLEYLTSISAQWGFIFQSIIAFYGCGFLIKRIVFNLTNRKDLGFYAMLIYVFSQTFAIFSLMILVDAPGWFLSLFIIDRAILLVKKETISHKHWILLSALSALGLLVKESVVYSFIFLVFYQFYTNNSLKNKIVGFALSCFVFAAIFLLSQIITYAIFRDSIIMRILFEHGRTNFVYYDNFTNILQLYRTFDVYWVLVVIGIISIKSSIYKYNIKNEILAFSWATVASLLIMPIWPYIIDRILFMIAPALVVYAVLSENYLKKVLLPLILIGGTLNILSTWLIYKYNTSGVLLASFIILALLVICSVFRNWRTRKKFTVKY